MRTALFSRCVANLVWLRRALILGSLAIACAAPQAWDADRMLQAAKRIGPRAAQDVLTLQQMFTGLTDVDDAARLDAVNQFLNRRIVFGEDAAIWKAVDYWASPLETLNQGMGDCEDFAIAKYFSLLAAGVSSSRMRLVYVRLQVGGPGGAAQAHMVLAYYATPQTEPLILDNLVTEIRPASRRPDLTPVFSFNSDGLWQGTGAQSVGDPAARLSRWRDVLAKARAEGFL
jgi:predicted transglutaminase-like cysteine proteinase